MNRRPLAATVAVFAIVFTCFSFGLTATDASDGVRTVALSSDSVPGAGAGVEFTGFYFTPALNQNSEVSFGGFFDGPGVGTQNDEAIFGEQSGAGMGMVARAGDPATGSGGGVFFENFDPPLMNSNGQAAFHANLLGVGVNQFSDTGIYRQGAQPGVGLVAREGNSAPVAIANVDYAGFSNLLFSDTGRTAFIADLIGQGVNPSNDVGIFRETVAPGVANVVRAGDPVPGTGAGVFYDEFPFLLMDKSGQLAFLAELDGANVGSGDNLAILREGVGGSIGLVARTGNFAPFGSGITYDDLREPDFNNNGQTAFTAELAGVGVNETNDEAMFRELAGAGPSLAYRKGNPAPGVGAGVTFNFLGNPLINDAGLLAFAGGLTGTGVDSSNDLAIFRESPLGLLELVARTGDTAPGTTAQFETFTKPLFNNSGQVAFIGILTGSGVTDLNDVGIFAEDSSGQLQLIAREGDLLDVSDDPTQPDLRMIADGALGSPENSAGRVSGFNDLGRVVFYAEFDDGSEGVFVANTDPNVILGDVNGDGVVNLLDVQPFIDSVSNGTFIPEADINQDGSVDLLDVQPFIDLLAT